MTMAAEISGLLNFLTEGSKGSFFVFLQGKQG